MTCALKNDMRNLVNFNTAHKNIKISTMRDVFVQGIQWGAKKIREELCVMTMQSDAIFTDKLTGGFKNENVKIYILMDSFGQEHIKFLLEKKGRVIYHDTEE